MEVVTASAIVDENGDGCCLGWWSGEGYSWSMKRKVEDFNSWSTHSNKTYPAAWWGAARLACGSKGVFRITRPSTAHWFSKEAVNLSRGWVLSLQGYGWPNPRWSPLGLSPALARLFQLSKSSTRDLRLLVGVVNSVVPLATHKFSVKPWYRLAGKGDSDWSSLHPTVFGQQHF